MSELSTLEDIIRIWKINKLKEVTLFGIKLSIEGNTFYGANKDIIMTYKERKYISLKKGDTYVKINLKNAEDVLVWILIYTFFRDL